MDLMHSFSARSDTFILAPSVRLFESLLLVSFPLSLPARSTIEILEYGNLAFGSLYSLISQMACERDETSLLTVEWVVRSWNAKLMMFTNSSALVALFSTRLLMVICPLLSSSTLSLSLPFKRSKSLARYISKNDTMIV